MALVPGRGETGCEQDEVLLVNTNISHIIGIGICIGWVDSGYLYEPPLLTVTLTPFCSLGSLWKCTFNESTFDQSLGQSADLDHRHSQGQSLVHSLVDVGVKSKEHFDGKVRIKS